MHACETEDPVIRDTRIWLEKAVIGLNLCPFAKGPYSKGLVRFAVADDRHLDSFLNDLDMELDRLLEMPADRLATTLLIIPHLFADFSRFNRMLDIAEDAIGEHGAEGIIQIAPFHPQFCFADCEENDLGNFTNRSPYPLLHLIREADIDKAVRSIPDPAAVFERNIALLHKMGREGWEALGIPRPS